MIKINLKRFATHWRVTLLFLGFLGSLELICSAPVNPERSKESRSLPFYKRRSLDQGIESPGDIAWRSWLLEKSDSSHNTKNPNRRITPKSVFIAPQLELEPCAEGYKADSMGRCQKIVNIDQEAYDNFVLQQLNKLLGKGSLESSSSKEKKQTAAAGPLQVNIPLLPDMNKDSDSQMEEDEGRLKEEDERLKDDRSKEDEKLADDSRLGDDGRLKGDEKFGNDGSLKDDAKFGIDGSLKEDTKFGNDGRLKDEKFENDGRLEDDASLEDEERPENDGRLEDHRKNEERFDYAEEDEAPLEAIPLETKQEESFIDYNVKNSTSEEEPEESVFLDSNFTVLKNQYDSSSPAFVVPIADLSDDTKEAFPGIVDYKTPPFVNRTTSKESKNQDDTWSQEESSTKDEFFIRDEYLTTIRDEKLEEATTPARDTRIENVTERPTRKEIINDREVDIASEMETWRNESDTSPIQGTKKNATVQAAKKNETHGTRRNEAFENVGSVEAASIENDEIGVTKSDTIEDAKTDRIIGSKTDRNEGSKNDRIEGSKTDRNEWPKNDKIEGSKTDEIEETKNDDVYEELEPDLEDQEYSDTTQVSEEDTEDEILKHGESGMMIPLEKQTLIRSEKKKVRKGMETTTFFEVESDSMATTERGEDLESNVSSEVSINKDFIVETTLLDVNSGKVKNSTEPVSANSTASQLNRDDDLKALSEAEKKLITEPEVVFSPQDNRGSNVYGRKRDGQLLKTNFQSIKESHNLTTTEPPVVSKPPRLRDPLPRPIQIEEDGGNFHSKRILPLGTENKFQSSKPNLSHPNLSNPNLSNPNLSNRNLSNQNLSNSKPNLSNQPNDPKTSEYGNYRRDFVKFPNDRNRQGYVRFPSDDVNSIHSPEVKDRFSYSEYSGSSGSTKNGFGINPSTKSGVSFNHNSGNSFNHNNENSFNHNSGNSYNPKSDNSYNPNSDNSYNSNSENSYNSNSENSYNSNSDNSYNSNSDNSFNHNSGNSYNHNSGNSNHNSNSYNPNGNSFNHNGNSFNHNGNSFNHNGNSFNHNGNSFNHNSGTSSNDNLFNQNNSGVSQNYNSGVSQNHNPGGLLSQKQPNWRTPHPPRVDHHQTFMQAQASSSNQNLLRFWERMPLLKDPSLDPRYPSNPLEEKANSRSSRVSSSRRINFYKEKSPQVKRVFSQNNRTPIGG